MLSDTSEQDKRTQLETIMMLSSELLCKAKRGDWIGVQEIEQVRKADISVFFSEPPPECLQSEIATLLRVLVDTEIALVELSTLDQVTYKTHKHYER